jgi:hypothetical protein
MKTSLWVVVVVLTGIVGLLVGYSTSRDGSSKRGIAKPEAGSAEVLSAVAELKGEIARLREAMESGAAPPKARAAAPGPAPAKGAAAGGAGAPAKPAAAAAGVPAKPAPAAGASGGYGDQGAAAAPAGHAPEKKPAHPTAGY